MARQFKRPAVIGATGQLGFDIARTFAGAGAAVAALSHGDLSVEDPASVEKMLDEHVPDILINTAAFHNVPVCEKEQRRALEVNALGPLALAQACRVRKIPFVTFSTDYVFDGTKGAPYAEDDEPHPLNVYGVSKLAGEMLAASAWEQTFVVRTSGLFGVRGSRAKGYTFIDRVLAQARSNEEIKVVTDITFSPSYTAHVASALVSVVERGAFGTYHLTNAGSCSWYEFAQEALRQSGLSAGIRPIHSSEWTDGVRRPPNSSLAHPRLTGQGLSEMPSWQRGVAAYLAERNAASSGVSSPGP